MKRLTLCRRQSRGFTLVELVVVLIVVSVLAAMAVDRLFYYQERAEKVAMLANLEAFKTGLRIEVAEMMVTNRGDRLATLERTNPVAWLEEPPPGWLGEYRVPTTPGSWYYSSAANELIYAPLNTRYLNTGSAVKDLRFRVSLKYGSNGAGGQAVTAATLAPVKPYEWFR